MEQVLCGICEIGLLHIIQSWFISGNSYCFFTFATEKVKKTQEHTTNKNKQTNKQKQQQEVSDLNRDSRFVCFVWFAKGWLYPYTSGLLHRLVGPERHTTAFIILLFYHCWFIHFAHVFIPFQGDTCLLINRTTTTGGIMPQRIAGKNCA